MTALARRICSSRLEGPTLVGCCRPAAVGGAHCYRHFFSEDVMNRILDAVRVPRRMWVGHPDYIEIRRFTLEQIAGLYRSPYPPPAPDALHYVGCDGECEGRCFDGIEPPPPNTQETP